MKNAKRLRAIYLFCHLLVPVAVWYGSPGWWLYALAWYFVLQVFGVGIGLHRLLAHRTFTPSNLHFRVLTFISTLSCMGSPLSWAAIHRLHHLKSDREGDPHDPRVLGIRGILLGEYNSEVRLPISQGRDLVASVWLTWMHRNYFLILFVYALILLAIDPRLLLFQFAVPVVLVYWATAIGIFLNHTWGYRNFETGDRSFNNWLLSLYTLGDGWHNNHHHSPSSYSHRVKWWEFDACALFIRFVFARPE